MDKQIIMEGYWVEIPCVDKEAAVRLANHLSAFAARITKHQVVREDEQITNAVEVVEPDLLYHDDPALYI